MTPRLPSSAVLFLTLLSTLLLQEVKAAWEETAKLTDPDGELEDMFANTLAINNGIVAVGARLDDVRLLEDDVVFTDAGSVTIFELVDREWSRAAKLIASDAEDGDTFGRSVAVGDGVVVVGAPLEDDGGTDAGAVYVFGKEADGTWTEQAKMLPSDISGSYGFGVSLAMQRNTLIVGARGGTGAPSNPAGAVYVYTFSADSWTENAKLTASDGSLLDHFGWAVAIDAETIVVGAHQDDDLGDDSGSAYILQLRGGGLWIQQAKLIAGDGTAGDRFGIAVAVEGDTVCVGSRNNADGDIVGAVYVYGQEGDTWTQQAKLVASDFEAGGWFGRSLALQDGVLFVGAQGQDGTTGAVYLFTLFESTWTEQAKLVSSDGALGDRLGFTVDFHDGLLFAGAPGDNGNQGSAYAFEWRASASPSIMPSVGLSMVPTQVSSSIPTGLRSTSSPSTIPSELPSTLASQEPSSTPLTSEPSSEQPSSTGSELPTGFTSEQPSDSIFLPSSSPSESTDTIPSPSPSTSSSTVPTQVPSVNPSSFPPAASRPSTIPSELPSTVASQVPSNTTIPSASSSEQPSSVASVPPTSSASEQPSESSTEPSGLATYSPGGIPSLPPSETSEIASNFSLSHAMIEAGSVRIVEGSIVDATALLNNTYTRAGFQVTYDASGFDGVASARLAIGGNFICLQASPFERTISADGFTEMVVEVFPTADCEGAVVHREQVSFNFYECPLGTCEEAEVEMIWTTLTQYNITNLTGEVCNCFPCPFYDSGECEIGINEESDVASTDATRIGLGYSDSGNRERELFGEHRSGFYERLEALNGGWYTSRANRTLLFKVQDSDECLGKEVQEGGGRRTASRRLNPAFSGGSGTATIHTERDVYMRLDIQGRAAATVVQNMTVWFDQELLIEGMGGSSSPNSPDCTNTDPRLTYFESSPIRIPLGAGSDHVLEVSFESASGTLGSYFQLVVAFEEIGDPALTQAPTDWKSPSEIDAPTTTPTQTLQDDPTESPSRSQTQLGSHAPSPPPPSTSPSHSTTISPTGAQSIEPTYSPTAASSQLPSMLPTDSSGFTRDGCIVYTRFWTVPMCLLIFVLLGEHRASV